MLSSASATDLRVLVALQDATSQRLATRLLAGAGADVHVVDGDVAFLSVVEQGPADLALIDVSFDNKAGLAWIHHVRQLHPDALIYALATRAHFDLASEATPLGSNGFLPLPLAGDEILTVLAHARTATARVREADTRRDEVQFLSHIDALGKQIDAAPERRAAARAVVNLYRQMGCAPVLLYLPAGAGGQQFFLAAHSASDPRWLSNAERRELLDFARIHGFEAQPLIAQREPAGLLLLGVRSSDQVRAARRALLAEQSALHLALLAEREQAQRSAMKDPRSSAYTFAYFVDVAGREIDKARRHQRRFALATIELKRPEGEGGIGYTDVELVDHILAAVRDTDILARVDDNEFYLLLPETGAVGAHTCRRRVLRQLGSLDPAPDVSVGLAVYPHEGQDLSHLLRVAARRAALAGPARQGFTGTGTAPLLAMLRSAEGFGPGASQSIEHHRAIELAPDEFSALVARAVSEGLRGGRTKVSVTERPGSRIAAGLREFVKHDVEGLAIQSVDTRGWPEGAALEVMTLTAEHGCYAIAAEERGAVLRVVHGAEPRWIDWLCERLTEAIGRRWVA